MTTYDALLADVIAAPEDDGPRLILADWLEDDGQPERALYVREAVAGRDPRLEPWHFWQWFGPLCLDAIPGSPAAWPEDSAYRRWRVGYAHQVADYRHPPWRLRMARGFVEAVEAPLDAWLSFAPRWQAATPLRRYRPLARREGRAADETRSMRAFFADERVCRLDTLDLTALLAVGGVFRSVGREFYRPWRGVRRLVLPPWMPDAEVWALRRVWPHIPEIAKPKGDHDLEVLT